MSNDEGNKCLVLVTTQNQRQ